MASANSPSELLHKVLVVGDGATGKTCLIRRYVHGIFQASTKSTIGVDFALKVLNHRDRSITLQIWDIAGQERYGQMTRVYYQSAVGALVVADVTKPETLEVSVKWKQDIDSKVHLNADGKPVPVVLLLNKVDLAPDESQWPRPAAAMDDFCRAHGFAGWYLTSAKDDMGVTPPRNAAAEVHASATEAATEAHASAVDTATEAHASATEAAAKVQASAADTATDAAAEVHASATEAATEAHASAADTAAGVQASATGAATDAYKVGGAVAETTPPDAVTVAAVTATAAAVSEEVT